MARADISSALLKASESQSTLALKLTDGSSKHFSTSELYDAANSISYLSQLIKINELKQTNTLAVDRTAAIIQNVDCAAGIDAVSASQKYETALATVGRYYRDIRNPATELWKTLLPGMVVGIAVEEPQVTLTIVPDYVGLGLVIGTRNETDFCNAFYKGIECGYAGALPTCTHKKTDCIAHGQLHRNQSFTFPEDPAASTPPGSAGNAGDTGTGGGFDRPCFIGENHVWTPRGDIPYWDMRNEMKKSRAVYSFDPLTGERYVDEIEYLMEHDVSGYFDFDFGFTQVGVTPEHPFFTKFKTFKPAFKFRRGDTAKAMPQRAMIDAALANWKWNWSIENPTKVFNIKVRHFETYFCNRLMVHNRKDETLDLMY